jgi:hypothetical protein
MEAFRSAIKALAQDVQTVIGLRAVGMGLTIQAISGTDNFNKLALEFAARPDPAPPAIPAPPPIPPVP